MNIQIVPIRPSDLYRLSEEEERRVGALITHLNDVLGEVSDDSSRFEIARELLRYYANPHGTDREIACAIARFREAGWSVEEMSAHGNVYIVFHLPPNRKR